MRRARHAATVWRTAVSAPLVLGSVVSASNALANDVEVHSSATSLPIPLPALVSHAGFIKKAAVDAAGRWVLTVSDDKTARVWNAATGALAQYLRVPIGAGHEGQLFAGALSPDGALAAVAGFTTGANHRVCVYLFDTRDGRLVGTLRDLPGGAVDNVAFSRDGKLLAIATGEPTVLIVVDLARQRELVRDARYSGRILGIDFSGAGDLVTTMTSGSMKLYRAREKLAVPRAAPLTQGREPMHARFSPDGGTIAIGFNGDPIVALLRTSDLGEQSVFRSALPDHRALHLVEWSQDGSSLFAGGESEGTVETPIIRLADRGRGQAKMLPGARGRLGDLKRFPDGSLLFVSGEPSVGRIAPSGERIWFVRSESVDMRHGVGRLQVSDDGARVRFLMAGERESRMAQFAITEGPERAFSVVQGLDAAKRAGTAAAGPGWRFEGIQRSYSPRINGQIIQLDPNEDSRSVTVSPSSTFAILGTSWSLRRLTAEGVVIWRTPLQSAVIESVVSRDDRWVVAALADGTIRWFRAEDGVEVIGLLPHRSGQDWIAWIPAGYYMSSLAGDELIGWHMNRGADREADFYRAVQFERILYRPDVVRSYFAARGNISTQQLAASMGAFNIARLDAIAPPTIRYSMPFSHGSSLEKKSVLHLEVDARSLDMEDYAVFVNGIPMTLTVERDLMGQERRRFERNVPLALASGVNDVRIEVYTSSSIGLMELQLQGAAAQGGDRVGDLYLLAIGVSEFDDSKIRDLKYAARDAEVLASVARSLEGSAFRRVRAKVLTTATSSRGGAAATVQPTRSNVERALSFINDATGHDTVIVFLASHGLSDAAGNYYFLASDADYGDVAKVNVGDRDVKSFLPWETFFRAMRKTAGRRILIVDTCQSANMQGSFDVYSLAKRSAASQFALIAASRGTELSQEYDPAQHGLFTFGLVDALRKRVDPNGDGSTSVAEVFEYANREVQRLHNKYVGPQNPVLIAPRNLRDTVLARTGKGS